MTWRLKDCPKCKGDMFFEHNSSGGSGWWLQCGYRLEEKHSVGLSKIWKPEEKGISIRL